MLCQLYILDFFNYLNKDNDLTSDLFSSYHPHRHGKSEDKRHWGNAHWKREHHRSWSWGPRLVPAHQPCSFFYLNMSEVQRSQVMSFLKSISSIISVILRLKFIWVLKKNLHNKYCVIIWRDRCASTLLMPCSKFSVFICLHCYKLCHNQKSVLKRTITVSIDMPLQ